MNGVVVASRVVLAPDQEQEIRLILFKMNLVSKKNVSYIFWKVSLFLNFELDRINLGPPEKCHTFTPGTACFGGRVYAITIEQKVVYGCTPPEAPDCTEKIALPFTKKTLESVEECISFCLGQTVHENELEEFYFNWLPDMQCLRTVYKLIFLKTRSMMVPRFWIFSRIHG